MSFSPSMYRTSIYFILPAMSLLWFASVLLAQQGGIYKWVDKDGRVHFSNAPPGDAKGIKPLGGERLEDPPQGETPKAPLGAKDRDALKQELQTSERTKSELQKKLSSLKAIQRGRELKIELSKELLRLREKEKTIYSYSVGGLTERQGVIAEMERAVRSFENEMEWLLGTTKDRAI